jgi:hypothetical protein
MRANRVLLALGQAPHPLLEQIEPPPHPVYDPFGQHLALRAWHLSASTPVRAARMAKDALERTASWSLARWNLVLDAARALHAAGQTMAAVRALTSHLELLDPHRSDGLRLEVALLIGSTPNRPSFAELQPIEQGLIAAADQTELVQQLVDRIAIQLPARYVESLRQRADIVRVLHPDP